jgi:uncharacterized lipoprotein YddW (UPF0748 family)
VLQKPGQDDLAMIQRAMERGLEAWPWIERGDFAAATMKLHTKPAKSES